MRIRGLRWLGVRADDYEATVRFFREALGMQVEFEQPNTVELSGEDGFRVQVFGPTHRYHDFFGRHASGPVPLFEVDDLAAAITELEAAGVRGFAEDEDDAWKWSHFRGPDGNLYAFAERKPVGT